ncbi:MAG: hypothetical protein ACKO3W_11660, partial [bacterium]
MHPGGVTGAGPGPRRGAGDKALYASLRPRAEALAECEPLTRLQPFADLLWDALSPRGLSWGGFYLIDASTPVDRDRREGAMLLAARRDKPACSPIGLHGV